MLVSELMSKTVVTVEPDTTLADAARIMLDRRISGLPVVDRAGNLVGIITEGDLIRRPELDTAGESPSWLKSFLMPSSLAADYARTHGRHVSEVMTRNPVCVGPDTRLGDTAALMRRQRIKTLPVLDGARLVGIIARTDLLRALSLKLIATQPKITDKAIGDHILAALARERWAPKYGIRVHVDDQVVDLEGIIFSDDERQAVRVIAENAPGVKQVRDNLAFVDPGSGMAIPAG